MLLLAGQLAELLLAGQLAELLLAELLQLVVLQLLVALQPVVLQLLQGRPQQGLAAGGEVPVEQPRWAGEGLP